MDKIRVKSMLLVLLALLAPVIGAPAATAAGKKSVKADTLTSYQETPATLASSATGSFSADIDEGAAIITYELRYSGLTTAATAAHIHFGGRFLSGGVSAFLCGGGSKPACPEGTTTEAVVTGTITAADIVGPTGQGIAAGDFEELVRAIRAGVTYANVHSTTFPGGEIRGQINDEDQRQP